MTGAADTLDIERLVRIVVRVVLEVLQERGTVAPADVRPASARRRLVTERDVLEAVDAGVLRLAPGAVVTPLARETAAAKGVELVVG